MKIKVVAFVVFLSGVALLANSLLSAEVSKQTNYDEQRPFVVQYLASRLTDGNTSKPYEFRVRYVHSSGQWKETRYSFDGKVVSLSGSTDGLYVSGKNSLQYYGKYNPERVKYPNASKEAITSSPQFSRMEKVAGLEAYVLIDAETGNELMVSVETGKTPLKIVSKFKRGDGQDIHVVEAVSVEFREVSEDEIRLPNLPISFDIAEQKVESLKRAGQNALAGELEQTISILKESAK